MRFLVEDLRVCVALTLVLILPFSDQDFNQTSFSSYEVITPKELKPKGDVNGMDASYVIMAEGKQYVLHLKPKTTIKSKDFSVYTYRDRKRLIYKVPNFKDDCYYHGYVEGYPDSVVGLSTCSGLSGFLHDRNFSYAIEPVQPFLNFKHLIYPVENTESLKCGLKNFSSWVNYDLNPKPKVEVPQTNAAYLELFVVVTRPLFEFYQRNETSVLHHIMATINIVDTIYQQVNVHIMLIGVEIWTKGNQIDTHKEDPQALLSSFTQWKVKHLDSRVKSDAALLALKEERVLVSGMTNFGGACHPVSSTSFVVFSSATQLNSALQMSHEIGHLLGMRHDTLYRCICDRRALCLMEPNGKISIGISGCSIKDLESFLNSDASFCLWNAPSVQTTLTKSPVCGNKLVEAKEECDCGPDQECKNICCDPATCKFSKGAKCASGDCCVHCQFATVGSPCRVPVSECDLAEYCDGTSSTCRADFYFQDGTPCNNGLSVCYKKNCYDYSEHCKKIFGQDATVGSVDCFKAVNTIGDRFGNCDMEKERQKCTERNALCGRVQCQNVEELHLFNDYTSIIQTPLGSTWCWGVDSNFGEGLEDLGFVPTGARCGAGKVTKDCLKCQIAEGVGSLKTAGTWRNRNTFLMLEVSCTTSRFQKRGMALHRGCSQHEPKCSIKIENQTDTYGRINIGTLWDPSHPT
ncbi:disintegrin and metalloproteinase domain-containing protein 9-like isoform X2 [Lissotriton helveticus]